jgi:hypothetical protein
MNSLATVIKYLNIPYYCSGLGDLVLPEGQDVDKIGKLFVTKKDDSNEVLCTSANLPSHL